MITVCKTALFVGIAAALAASGAAYGAVAPGGASTQGSSQEQASSSGQAVTDAAVNKASRGAKHGHKTAKPPVQQLQAVQVVGLRRSTMKAIELKRTAPGIQDSISEVGIGQLPDVTIADSLSRITGVQVDHVAGEGATINIRGLPEVSTLVNGEAFVTADNIYSIQPNFETLPSELFSGADVLKSATANNLTSGISGTINLRTRRPWDLPFGWTVNGTVEGGRGSVTKKTEPSGNVLIGYNDQGNWGILLAASYSDFAHNYSNQGWRDNGVIAGENSSSATSTYGYLKGWSGFPVPPGVVSLPNGGVDVNGDGTSNGAFYSPPRFLAANEVVQPKRTGLNSSFQMDLGSGFTVTADGFYSTQTTSDLTSSIISLPVNQRAPTSLPAVSTPTNALLTNNTNSPGVQSGNWAQTFNTVQDYNVWVGDMEPESKAVKTRSISRNFDVALNFDNGGALTGNLRFVNATASQLMNEATIDLSSGNGVEWPNALMPGVTLPPTVYVHPANMGGNFPFNPNGSVPYSYAMNANFGGTNPVVSFPAAVASSLAQQSSYAVKGVYGDGSSAHAGMNVIRADGHYHFSDQFNVDFGLRNSIRSADLNTYVFGSRVYAGNGASDPAGCLVRFNTANRTVDGEGVPGACTAGNAYGYFRANQLAGPLAQLPGIISSNLQKLVNPGQVSGMVGYAINPNSMKNPYQWYNTVTGGTATQVADTAQSWNVLLKERTAYGQANFNGDLAGHSFSGNFGVRIVRTNLGVTQNLSGMPQPYGFKPLPGGTVHTGRQYTDILPAINVAIDLTPKLVLRLAEAKNMMPLSLNEWGGGFKTNYQSVTTNGQTVQAITSASSSGNPNLKPWRSTNYGASLEYYMNPGSMLSLAWFRINMASFIVNSSVINCSLPDEDGVVRNRCIGVTQPVQGTGAVIQGFEGDYRQAFTFLPGFLSHTGMEINATWAPSNTGKTDLAGHAIPFQDNSKKSGNLIIWYQHGPLQVRLAGNYRSQKAVSSNYAGINGFELYQMPTKRLDASVTYQVNRHLQVFLQGQNLTNERQSYFWVWPNEKFTSRLSERYFMLGARLKL